MLIEYYTLSSIWTKKINPVTQTHNVTAKTSAVAEIATYKCITVAEQMIPETRLAPDGGCYAEKSRDFRAQ